VPILIDETTTYLGAVAVPLCQSSSTVNLGGFTLSAWLYFDGPSLPPETFVFFSAWGPSGNENSPALTNTTVGTWLNLSLTFSSAIQADHVAIYLNPGGQWSGTMYIDTVTLTGP
jgi:hypothetical protein